MFEWNRWKEIAGTKLLSRRKDQIFCTGFDDFFEALIILYKTFASNYISVYMDDK